MAAYGEETFNNALKQAAEAIGYIIDQKRSRAVALLDSFLDGDYQDAIDFYNDEDPATAEYLIKLKEAILAPVK